MVDFIYNDFSERESEREGVQEKYSYHGGTTTEAGELDLLAKAVASSLVEKTTS